MKNTFSSQRYETLRLKKYKKVQNKESIPRMMKMAKTLIEHLTEVKPNKDFGKKQNLKHDKKKVEQFMER